MLLCSKAEQRFQECFVDMRRQRLQPMCSHHQMVHDCCAALHKDCVAHRTLDDELSVVHGSSGPMIGCCLYIVILVEQVDFSCSNHVWYGV